MKLVLPVIYHQRRRWAVVYHEPDDARRLDERGAEVCYLRDENGRQAMAIIRREDLEHAEVRTFRETLGK